jgi:hypothetical protein
MALNGPKKRRFPARAGDLQTVMVCDRSLTDAERASVEAHLMEDVLNRG